MPIIPEFNSTLDELRVIHKKKNDDYANTDNPFFNFDVQQYVMSLFSNERDKVFASMIGLKLARLANILNKNGEVNFESVLDSFNDGAAYLILFKADYMRRTKTRKMSSAMIEGANTV